MYEAAGMVTDAMVDAVSVAGEVDRCRERIVEVCRAAREHGFDQVMFSKLGPDFREAPRLLAGHVLSLIR